MQIETQNNALKITISGTLTTDNAARTEEEIKPYLNGYINEIEIDANKLEYISSAGLRVILGLAKTVPNTKVINVSRDVYDIFEMTGFINFLKVERKLREISIDGCPIIGEGATATVYRLDKDTIVKVFKIDRTIERVKEEINLAKQAFIYGVPTAISFDIVNVKGKLGVVFEMIDAYSICDLIKQNPSDLDKYIDMLVSLLKTLRETDASKSNLRNAKGFYLDQLEYIKEDIDETHYEKAKKLLIDLPDESSLVHGDFHIKNIMVQKGEPLLIDMDTVSVGSQIFEFGAFYISYIAYPETEPGNTMKFFGLPEDVCSKIFYDSIRKSFPSISEEKYKENLMKIQAVGSIRMCFFCKEGKENEIRTRVAKENLYEALDSIDNLILNK